MSIKNIITEIKWIIKNKPAPPPHFIKQRIIKQYGRKYSLKSFIETGTNEGDTIIAVKDIFKKIYSIELDKQLFNKAKNKFQSNININIFNGDSSTILPVLLEKIDEPVLFWLDGHYSGGVTAKGILNTPIYMELNSIFNHKVKNHVILIDDARLFIGKDDYPKLEEIEELAKSNKYSKFKILNDIIVITQ